MLVTGITITLPDASFGILHFTVANAKIHRGLPMLLSHFYLMFSVLSFLEWACVLSGIVGLGIPFHMSKIREVKGLIKCRTYESPSVFRSFWSLGHGRPKYLEDTFTNHRTSLAIPRCAWRTT